MCAFERGGAPYALINSRPHPPLPGQIGGTGGDLTCLIIKCPNMGSLMFVKSFINPLLSAIARWFTGYNMSLFVNYRVWRSIREMSTPPTWGKFSELIPQLSPCTGARRGVGKIDMRITER